MTNRSAEPAATAVRGLPGTGSVPVLLGRRAGQARTWWNALTGALGAIAGRAPHVLHHIGLLAGTALVAGAGGTALFGILGLALSVPMLLRLRRRFASWWAPAIGLAVFVVMFSISAFVIGPAINSGTSAPPGGGQPTPS